MRWVLNTFHRPFLIRISLIFQPLLRWYFSGNQFEDPIDGSKYRNFYPMAMVKNCVKTLLSWHSSLERHRLLWLYLSKETNFLNQPLKVLHLAPEQVFYRLFKKFDHWDYTTTDLYSPLAEVKADICKLPFESNIYDLVFCNHVLEHVPDDQKAMSELYRVLKKGGTLIAQVPIKEDRLKTFENWSITSPDERAKVFGQYDHVRIYGQDYYSRLEKVGFKTKAFDLISKLKPAEIIYFGLKKEKIPVAVKNH